MAELSDDYEKLFETKIGYDVIIYAGEEPNVKEIHAHSNILCIKSQYFRSAFSNNWSEKKNGKFIFKKPNVLPHLFNIILRFIYCHNIKSNDLQGSDILKLLVAADELDIQPLIFYIQEFLTEHPTEFIKFLEQDPIEILETIYTIYQHELFADLLNFCLENICRKPKSLFDSDHFITLKAPLLEFVINRDDLNINEIEVWDSLLKWCIAQMKSDPTKWNKENIPNLEKKFIPFFRILPKDLIHDVLESHIVPDIKPTSVIPCKFLRLSSGLLINSKFSSYFSSWIDRKSFSYYNKKRIPYKFELLYNSRRDGFNANSFHKNCDNKGPTIWIAKIRDSNQIIGGYNPLSWDQRSGNKNTKDSFLFKFTNGKFFTVKLGYVNKANYALWCVQNQGPSMGNLFCSDTNHWFYNTYGSIYPKIGIPESFIVKDYEVFQVILSR